MIAFKVYPCEYPTDCGCLLVCSHSRNEARSWTVGGGPWADVAYIDFHAIRMPAFDYICFGGIPFSIETNAELPEGCEEFYDDN